MKPILNLLLITLIIICWGCNNDNHTDAIDNISIHDTIKSNANKKLIITTPFTIKSTPSKLQITPELGAELYEKLSIEGALAYILDVPDSSKFACNTAQIIIGDINQDQLLDMLVPIEAHYGQKQQEMYYIICLNNGETLEVREYFFRGSNESEYLLHFNKITDSGIVIGKHIINTSNPYMAQQSKKNKEIVEYPLSYKWDNKELISN